MYKLVLRDPTNFLGWSFRRMTRGRRSVEMKRSVAREVALNATDICSMILVSDECN
jgi:hypothetical protein